MTILYIGIGRATAIALAQAGWSVAIVARRVDKLRETSELCGGDSSKVYVFEGDVTQEDDVTRLFRTTVEHFGTSYCSHLPAS